MGKAGAAKAALTSLFRQNPSARVPLESRVG
jgi:hypothetical protein